MHDIIQTRVVHKGWATVRVATVRMPDGRSVMREIEDHGSAVCVLPYNPDRKTAVLVRQFRAPVLFAAGEQETLEAIAGILDESDPALTARREAMEEAGLVLASLRPIAVTWSMPGISTERMHFFLATYQNPPREGDHGLATEAEVTRPVEMALPELAARADAGAIQDLKTLLILQTLRLREPTLFVA